jgi:hypothetical protein
LKATGQKIVVTNELGSRVDFVVALDDQGQVFSKEAIGDRATTEMKSTTHSAALRRLRQLLAENQPEVPAALADDRTGFSRLQRRQQRRLFRLQYGLEYGAERLSDNLQSEATAALVGSGAETVLDLPPRSYVAITEHGPEVELGIPGATEDASFHVVVGNW